MVTSLRRWLLAGQPCSSAQSHTCEYSDSTDWIQQVILKRKGQEAERWWGGRERMWETLGEQWGGGEHNPNTL